MAEKTYLTTESRLKLPHSLEGLTAEEIRVNRPEIHRIVAPLLALPRAP